MAARKPTAVLKIEGGYRSDRHGQRGDNVPVEGVPEMPADLPEVGARLWGEIVPALVSARIVGRLDTPALADLCRWYARYHRFALAADAADPDDKAAYRKLISASIAWKHVDKLASRFGLTPCDRAKLQLPAPRPEPVARRDRDKSKFFKTC